MMTGRKNKVNRGYKSRRAYAPLALMLCFTLIFSLPVHAREAYSDELSVISEVLEETADTEDTEMIGDEVMTEEPVTTVGGEEGSLIEDPDLPGEEVNISAALDALEPEETESVTEDEAETEPETEAESESETVEILTEEAETEAESKTETEAEVRTGGEVQCTVKGSITLYYDDRYSLKAKWPGYAILDIQTSKVTSYQVVSGQKKSAKDKAVIRKGIKELSVIAAGTGTAVVTIVPEKELEDAKAILTKKYDKPYKIIEGIQVVIEVKAAPLTVMYLGGQSNMEGVCPGTNYQPSYSVNCKRGTVYSTFPAKTENRGTSATGVQFTRSCPTGENAADFVAGSLAYNKSISGKTLEYPVYGLTGDGQGKTGPDSALAWKWNALTGDKVWVINAGYGGSGIMSWMQGKALYTRADRIYSQAQKTLNAEIKAGHYSLKHKLMFWLQGEADYAMSPSVYESSFLNMYSGLQSKYGFEKWGIITTRGKGNQPRDAGDIHMTGPRIAQYLIAAKTDNKVWIVSNENEQWVTDAGVNSYFSARYPGGTLTYPMRVSGVSAPKTVKQVHPSVHYAQVGHNENGICAAQGMYNIMQRKGTSPQSVSWYDSNHNVIKNNAINMTTDRTAVPIASPATAQKGISVCKTDPDGCVRVGGGRLVRTGIGEADLQIRSASGKVMNTMHVTSLFDKISVSIKNEKNGIRITWTKSALADGVKIYRRADKAGTSYQQIAVVKGFSKLTYLDTAVNTKSGTAYIYAVVPYNSRQTGSKSTVNCTRLTSPAITVDNHNDGLRIKWTKPNGATAIRVYRKTGSADWEKIATVDADKTEYVDTKVSNGKTYSYCVKAVSGTSVSSTSETKSYCRVVSPDQIKAVSKSSAVQVSWNAVAGADRYLVYRRKAGEKSYGKLGFVKGTSYQDASAVKGVIYEYAVRAYRGTYISDYHSYRMVKASR